MLRLGYRPGEPGRYGDRQFRPGDFEPGLNLTTLGAIDSVAQLGPQFLDLDFEFVGHLYLLDACDR